jgi:hypothetical protein
MKCLLDRRTTERRETVTNRRAVLARKAEVSAVVKAGHEEVQAAQMLMRRMRPPPFRRRSRARRARLETVGRMAGRRQERRRLATSIRLSRGSSKGFHHRKAEAHFCDRRCNQR